MFDLFEKWDGTPRANDSSSSTSTDSSTQSDQSTYQPYNPYPQNNNQKIFVVSLGGSVFFNEKLRAPEIAKFCEILNELIREGNQFVLVVGGGRVARVYQAGAKSMGANNFELDEVGIAVTRANALFFTYGIDNSWRGVLTDPKEAERVLLLGKTPIFGGTIPGQTTDAVGAIIAELMGADFINVSNVDGIYSADPAKEPGARMYKELTHTKMVSLLKAQASKPGAHTFVDPHAAAILQRSKIRSYFISGNDVENFKSIIRGNPEFKGTIVRTENTTTENQEE